MNNAGREIVTVKKI